MAFNRYNHSVLGEIRPRFKLKIDADAEDALQNVEKQLYNDKTVSGERSKNLLFLKTPTWQQHYWSPELTVRIEKEEFTDYTTVSCLAGPRQSVWAMFTMIYAAIGLVTVFGGIFALVKYGESGMNGWIWVIPIGVILFISVFFTAKIGQKKGRDQTLHLVSFIYHALESFTHVERLNH